MSRTPDDSHALLGGTPETIASESSQTSNPLTPLSPQSPVRSRHTYHRSNSSGLTETKLRVTVADEQEEEEEEEEEADISEIRSHQTPSSHGLGISTITTESTAWVIPRRPVGTSSRTPRSTESLVSPFSGSGSTAQENSSSSFKSTDRLFDPFKSPGSGHSSYRPTFSSDTEFDILKPAQSVPEIPGSYAGDHGPGFSCKTRKIHQRSSSWLSITILILSIYSTTFSGIYLGLALIKPRYGKRIDSRGDLTPSTASTLSTLIAKTIELSFVTVFVAFLGQALSRNAFRPNRGVTIAEMCMRSWIMQPGTLITHWEAVKYAGLTSLGGIALTTAVMATLYTTAADALVSPKLKFGHIEHRLLYGNVTASYANLPYIEDKCPNLIPLSVDNLTSACVSLQHVGAAYHDFELWQAAWAELNSTKNYSSTSLRERPLPVSTLFDNTSVTGSWIEEVDMNNVPHYYNRMVNNVTMAMPHANVFAAVRNPLNSILQPEDLNGLGEYYVTASVPSPAVNVLCATLTKDELEPITYESWNNGKNRLNVTTWPWHHNLPDDEHCNATLGGKLDELFNFGRPNPSKPTLRCPPMFSKIPLLYNTVANYTGVTDRLAVYILGTSLPALDPTYFMCSLQSALSPNCSTRYHASLQGGSLSSHCEDGADLLSYNTSQPKAPHGFLENAWRNVSETWLPALALGAGISDGDASTARVLTQYIPRVSATGDYALNRFLPSTAEGLAVLAGSTLLMSTKDTPFIHFWNYSTENENILTPPQIQGFNASLQTQDYSSGGAQKWQGLFYTVLILVFVTNVFCLSYLLLKKGVQITDYTEPQNLFSLAVNSRPSRLMARACGAGPQADQFRFKWKVEMDQGEHFQVRCLDEAFRRNIPDATDEIRNRSQDEGGWETIESETETLYKRLGSSNQRLLSCH